jgi:hypothetical protein
MAGENADWIRDFYSTLGEVQSAGALSGLQQRLGPAIANRTITAETASEMSSAIGARRREMQGVSA